MNTTTEMQLVDIDKLIPYANNARTHSPEQITKLRSSLREFGFVNPILIDADFNVIAGHGRLLAAKAECIPRVPCVFVDYMTDAQKKAYILADNRMAMDAGWDDELVAVELAELQDMGFELGLTGFDEKELAGYFDMGNEAQEDTFDVDAELQKPTFCKAGDVWKLGRHTLVCGDSTKPETYAALLGDTKVNLILTDPPYNVNYEGSAGKIQNDNMAADKFYSFLLDAFTCMEKAMAVDASVYIFHKDAVLSFCDRTDSKCVELLSNELEQAGFHAEEVPETLTVQMPRETLSEDALHNLHRIVVNKQNLLCHAFGTESLSIVETEQTFDFPWFTIQETGDGDAYAKFISCLCAFAKAHKRVNNKPDTGDNEKYAFRCFLLRLGMIGDDYKATRKVLLRNLSGSAAFRHGKEGADDVISE